MTPPVAKLSDLRKRIGRFLTEKACGRNEVHQFLAKLEPIGELAIFGDMIRDIAFTGLEGFNSDIDLVIDVEPPLDENEQFLLIISNYSVERNKFGGFRISLISGSLIFGVHKIPGR